jgi:RNA polymerase sigma-70 factor (ECF subfamily)
MDNDQEFSRLLMGEEQYLRAFASKLARNHADAEDLVQDTLMRAFASRRRFVEGSNIRAWTSTILRRLFLSMARKKKFRRNTQLEDSYDAVAREEGSTPVSFEECSDVLDEAVRRAIMLLPPLYQEAFTLSVLLGYTEIELGERLGIPRATAASRTHRAKRLLRERLHGFRSA